MLLLSYATLLWQKYVQSYGNATLLSPTQTEVFKYETRMELYVYVCSLNYLISSSYFCILFQLLCFFVMFLLSSIASSAYLAYYLHRWLIKHPNNYNLHPSG